MRVIEVPCCSQMDEVKLNPSSYKVTSVYKNVSKIIFIPIQKRKVKTTKELDDNIAEKKKYIHIYIYGGDTEHNRESGRWTV